MGGVGTIILFPLICLLSRESKTLCICSISNVWVFFPYDVSNCELYCSFTLLKIW
uniref:Uncharacterized protein n=1 Tax=Setaria viridis TaxID=4556 RepID=A0A4V6DA82_SETVI|nr:hypothetical protein SEVIR_3G324906v2 [Setaria viridis]